MKDWLWDDKYLLLKLLTTPDYLFLLIFIFLLPSKSLTKPCKGASGRGKINKQTNKQTNKQSCTQHVKCGIPTLFFGSQILSRLFLNM